MALPLLGQQEASGPVVAVLTIKDLSPGTDTRDYEQTITQAVGAAFGGGSFQIVPESIWRDAASSRSIDLDQPLSEAHALEVAHGVGASLVVTGVYSVQNEEVYYSIQCWDVASEKLAAGIQASTPFNLAFFSALNLSLSRDLLPKLSAKAGPTPPSVVFTSRDEGMEVRLSGDRDIGRVTNGRISLPADGITAGTKVLLQKTRPGYHPAEQSVTLSTTKEVALKPLVPEHRGALELDSTVGQLLGLGAALRSYRNPDWFFITVGGYLWVQPPANIALRAVVHADLCGGVGGYVFLPPDAPVRLGVSTGAGFIVSAFSTPGFPGYIDYYLDVLNWWLEAGFPGTTFFVRQEFKYALGMGNNLLGQGWMISRFPPTTLGVLFRW
jgi:hypothetical protein